MSSLCSNGPFNDLDILFRQPITRLMAWKPSFLPAHFVSCRFFDSFCPYASPASAIAFQLSRLLQKFPGSFFVIDQSVLLWVFRFVSQISSPPCFLIFKETLHYSILVFLQITYFPPVRATRMLIDCFYLFNKRKLWFKV